MFDEFGRVDVGHENRSHERLVDFLHHGDGALAVAADDDAVGLHQVWHGAAFTQELGIADDIKLRTAFVVAADRFGDLLAGFHRHGALIHNHAVLTGLEDGGDFAGDFLDVGKIDAAISLGRSRHSNENNIRAIHAFFGAGGEMQALRGDIAVDQFLEAGLVDRHFAGAELGDLFLIVVDANHIVADFREARPGDEADIS